MIQMAVVFWIRLFINSFESFINLLNVVFSPVFFSFSFLSCQLLPTPIHYIFIQIRKLP